MSKKLKLIKNTFILLLGKVSTQFITLLLLPLYTTYLTTSEYGLVDLLNTYIILLVPIITLQLELATFRYLIDCRNDNKQKKVIISNCYSIVLNICLIIIMLFLLLSLFIKINHSIYFLLMLISTISSNILLQTCRGLGDNKGYSIGCALIAFVNIIVNIVLLIFFHFGIYSIFISTIVSNFSGSIILFFRNKIYKYFDFKLITKGMKKELISYSLPLVPTGLMWWIIDTSDRTIISILLGVSANGIYSVSNKFSNIINSFYSIFNMSWTESVSMYINDKDGFLETSFNTIFDLVCSFCLCLINSMFLIFPILINSKYENAYKYIPILIISSIFNMLSANLSAIYIAKKETKKIAYTTIIASILNITINCVLINTIGLYAAALSTLISFAILFVLRYIDTKKYVNIKLNRNKVLMFIILFIVSFIIYEINNYILSTIIFILTLVIVFIVNKNEIDKMYRRFLRR